MGRGGYLLLGAAIGGAAAVLVSYLFGPAKGATYDANYRSRLDFALEEGQRAQTAREAQMRQQIEDFRRLPSQTPSNGPQGPA